MGKRLVSKREREVVVRGMAPRDLAGAVRLFANVYREPPYREKWGARDAGLYLKRIFALERRGCFVVSLNGALAGVLIGYQYPYRGSRIFYIHELFVGKAFRRRGLARLLLEKAIGIPPRETVFTMFAHRKAAAMKFYRRLGFRAPEFYRFYYARMKRASNDSGGRHDKRR